MSASGIETKKRLEGEMYAHFGMAAAKEDETKQMGAGEPMEQHPTNIEPRSQTLGEAATDDPMGSGFGKNNEALEHAYTSPPPFGSAKAAAKGNEGAASSRANIPIAKAPDPANAAVSLSAEGGTHPSPSRFPLENFGSPVDGKPDTFLVRSAEGELLEIGPDTIIGLGRDLTERERDFTERYLVLRSKGELRCCCPKKDKLELDSESGLPRDGAIHHFVRLQSGYRLHQMKHMAWAYYRHNASLRILSPVSKGERESKQSAAENPKSFRPTSGETAASWRQYPLAVKDAFHPATGRLAVIGQSVVKDWYVNNLPDLIGMGRATTYGKYVHEWVSQGYLNEEASAEGVKLVRTGKSVASLLMRELGIRTDGQEAAKRPRQVRPEVVRFEEVKHG